MFDLNTFISNCRDVVEQDSTHLAVREVAARVVEEAYYIIDGEVEAWADGKKYLM
jgi:hypothetical protein